MFAFFDQFGKVLECEFVRYYEGKLFSYKKLEKLEYDEKHEEVLMKKRGS